MSTAYNRNRGDHCRKRANDRSCRRPQSKRPERRRPLLRVGTKNADIHPDHLMIDGRRPSHQRAGYLYARKPKKKR